MKRRLLLLPLASVAAGLLALSSGASSPAALAQHPPGPSSGEVLVSGLLQPKGVKMGPDGMLYVAESGTGGNTPVEVDGVTYNNGFTGRISRIDPETGERETVAEGLPSNAMAEGEAVGPADIDWIGGQLYYLQTHGGEAWGFPDNPTGIYEVSDDGEVELVADIYEFNVENPVEAIDSGAQPDIEVGGNPYAMTVRNGAFYVVDGNHNRLMRVTTGGDIEEVVEFPDHPVSTGIDYSGSGPFYVAYLGLGPFPPEQGKVVTVAESSGTIANVASGRSMLTDVEFGPGGQLYALQFNDTTAGEFPAFGPFSGSLLRVSGSSMVPVVDGLSFAASVVFDDNTAYISNFSVTPEGEIIKVENVSGLQPIVASPTAAPAAPTTAPAATATRPTGVRAPDTGTGGGGDNGVPAWLIMTLLGGVVMLGAGAALQSRRA